MGQIKNQVFIKAFTVLFLLFISARSFAQVEENDQKKKKELEKPPKELTSFPRAQMLRMQATISPGFMVKPSISNIYLHGDIEYYLEENISLRSDIYYFLNTVNNYKPFKFNQSLFTGVVYHFRSQAQFDPYLGVQPGIAFTQTKKYELLTNEIINSKTGGFNYYAAKYFHLFISARYIHGEHLSDLSPIQLDEFRISFGLGWNFRLKKENKTIKTDAEPAM